MAVPVFELLRRTNDASDFIKTFDTFEPQIAEFGNMFRTNIILMNNVYLESFILKQKRDFLNQGYLCLNWAYARSRRLFEIK